MNGSTNESMHNANRNDNEPAWWCNWEVKR
ncbi:MAG: hypothetical protein MASP_00519 [Candidatus Methanolliviera sp. GoM_asphalt]|nr:MAG: hypothetical protein MASP_00519 [Candidatus Methanolliviera sp. GoM_asphalt]